LPFIATKDVSFDSLIDYSNGVKIPFTEKANFKLAPANTPLICAEGGSAGRKIGFTNQDICFGNKLFALVPNKNVDSKFLFYYYFSSSFQKHFSTEMAGIIGGVSMRKFKDIEIPLPPLPEQQRIVSILDKAFSAIDKAKANAEQNLKNTKELFESYLQGVFEKKEDGWEEKMLKELADERCTLSYGIVQPGEEFDNGLPVIRPTDLTSRYIKAEGLKRIDPKLADGYKRTKLIGDELLLCVRGTTGVVSIATLELKDANVTRGIVPIRFNSKFINQKLGYYLLISNYVQKQIRAKTYGTALMQINIGDLRKILTPYPSLKEQQALVRQLDALRAKTQKLEAIYQQKRLNLKELKKSILQKAFAGELTSSVSASNSVSSVIPLSKIKGISATDLQAGITAIALQKHIEQKTIQVFGHVKAEKIIHLAEYILNIDLERNPVKDTAGPNDFPHAQKVESRARKAGFYKVYKNGDSYNFEQGKSINNIVQKTQTCLGNRLDALYNLLDLTAPMSTQQSEIVATLFAAWNNLIIDKLPITDEAIVFEARENWHASKLSIPRAKFFSAVQWMRDKNIIPTGLGKKVQSKLSKK